MKRTMQAINKVALDTIAACGDVNRNVMTASNPYLSKAHKAAYDLGKAISDTLLPKTGAYHEIWLDGEKVEQKTHQGEGGRGAALRRPLSAAQVQDGHRRPA